MSDPNASPSGGLNHDSWNQPGYGTGAYPGHGAGPDQGLGQGPGQPHYAAHYMGQGQPGAQSHGYYPEQYPAYAGYGNGGYGYGGWNQPQRTHGMTTAAMVLGILAAALSLVPFVGFLAFILGPLAMVLGIVGIAKRLHRRGFSVTGLVTGAFGVLVSILYALLFTTMMSFMDSTDTYEFVTRSAGEYHISLTTTEATPEVSNNQRGTFNERHAASSFYGGIVATNVGDNAGAVGCKIFDSDGELVAEDADEGIGAQAQCMIGAPWMDTGEDFDTSGILDARAANHSTDD